MASIRLKLIRARTHGVAATTPSIFRCGSATFMACTTSAAPTTAATTMITSRA
jgi:hypothetical protein